MTTRILVGDWIEQLRTLASNSVQCVVTSPPYWGLRDYGVPGQLGLEDDPADYLRHLVEGFREVRRVLRPDGTLWLNMGDSFTDGGRGDDVGSTLHGTRHNQQECRKTTIRQKARPFGLGRKQLLMMPARVALALQEDGWYLRSDIIWHKPNPMPESTTDRCTRAHEYLFLFSKRARYFYDAKAIAEPTSGTAHHRGSGANPKAVGRVKVPSGWATDTGRAHTELRGRYTAERTARPQSRRRELGEKGKLADTSNRSEAGARMGRGAGWRADLTPKQNDSFAAAMTELVPMRNKRDVWTIRPEAFKGAHFATFPKALARLCILAGSSTRACELCGAPWRPVYGNPVAVGLPGSGNKARKDRSEHGGPAGTHRRQAHAVPWKPTAREIIGEKPTCDCTLAAGSARSLILDTFGGAGTTGLVADELGRDAVLIELNPTYADMARGRLAPAPKEIRA